MSDGKKEVLFSDVAIALDIISLLIHQINIPAARAQEFAITTSVLAELKAFVEKQMQEGAEATGTSDTTSQTPEETPSDDKEA